MSTAHSKEGKLRGFFDGRFAAGAVIGGGSPRESKGARHVQDSHLSRARPHTGVRAHARGGGLPGSRGARAHARPEERQGPPRGLGRHQSGQGGGIHSGARKWRRPQPRRGGGAHGRDGRGRRPERRTPPLQPRPLPHPRRIPRARARGRRARHSPSPLGVPRLGRGAPDSAADGEGPHLQDGGGVARGVYRPPRKDQRLLARAARRDCGGDAAPRAGHRAGEWAHAARARQDAATARAGGQGGQRGCRRGRQGGASDGGAAPQGMRQRYAADQSRKPRTRRLPLLTP
mmetsp:Transcript_9186/g.30278  ORF Transcript_9186/g.30278 Transcript_9186/m.30278 type:complete len:288 (-) Transcript_9186:51-914(-)